MKKIIVEGRVCIGPHFTDEEFLGIKTQLEDMHGLETLADLLGVIGSPVRLKIIYLLQSLKEICVCDLAEILEITDSAVSQHLRKLKDRHIIKSRKDSQSVYYLLEDNQFVNNLLQFTSLLNLDKKYELIVQ